MVPLLESGKEEQARVELEQALIKDPNNKLALSLMRQIREDPVAWLGKESFNYLVKANDTLSSIAGQQLKERDKYLFYILARYNNIAVPKQISVGQTIRVPGKKGQTPPPPPPPPPPPSGPSGQSPTAGPPPAPPAPTPPPPAPAAVAPPGDKDFRQGSADEQAGRLERAREGYKAAADAGHPSAPARLAAVTKKLVDRYTGEARTARSKQNLDAAIAAWDKVLALDPDNADALRERPVAVELKKLLDQQTRGAPKN